MLQGTSRNTEIANVASSCFTQIKMLYQQLILRWKQIEDLFVYLYERKKFSPLYKYKLFDINRQCLKNIVIIANNDKIKITEKYFNSTVVKISK